MTRVSEIVALYPNLVEEDTGGGCTALVHPIGDGANGARIMITSVANECCSPDDSDAVVLCGRYESYEDGGRCEEVPVEQLEGWIDAHTGL